MSEPRSNGSHDPPPVESGGPEDHPTSSPGFPVQTGEVDWELLAAQRADLLETVDAMPAYLLKPEVLVLLDAAKHPADRLILDLMWTTGARPSEVFALRPSNFVDDDTGFGVDLRASRLGPGRPNKAEVQRRRYIPIEDPVTVDRVQSYLTQRGWRHDKRLFPMVRQTLNRHIHEVVERAGGAPVPVSSHTFRHSFAVHLLLHGRPLDYVSRLLGHKSIQSTEIYTHVLMAGGGHLLKGVEFH